MAFPPPPPTPLDLPESPSPYAVAHSSPSRSPLRNGVTLDPVTGTLSEDGSPDLTDDNDPWGTRGGDQMNHSPSPSITKFASSFAQRVGSLVSSVSPGSQSGYLPTEAEIEAEAELQREKSRREAERILTREAVERKKVEERVLEMLEASRARPTRSQTTPSPAGPPSPTPSDKGGGSGWWLAAKNKLTPTKDKELTPAQQIVLDTKAREKEKRKTKDKEWPSNGKSKYHDPAYQSLSLPPGARPPGGMVGGGANVTPGSPSPHSNRPARQLMGSPSPSPSRTPDHSPIRSYSNNVMMSSHSPQPGTPPALSTTSPRDPPPLYAQFSGQGSLDVPATLLTIARRFEKLERWSVGHVRALEERMSDVEKWLVDKERERERDTASSKLSLGTQSDASTRTGESDAQLTQQVVREVTIERQTVEVDTEVKREVNDMKDELGELRSRVGELGREMARLTSDPSNAVSHFVSPSEASGFGISRIVSPGTTGSNTPATPSPRTLPSVPTDQDQPQSPSAHSIAQSETASIISTSTATRTKLPYPTGDYTSPSPPSSPRPSASQNVGNYTANNASSHISRTRPMSYSGLPIPQTNFSSSVGLPRSSRIGDSASSSPSLPPPSSTRPISTSPSPRKRYTVALGQPLSSSPSTSSTAPTPPAGESHALVVDEQKADFGEALFSEPQPLELQTAFFSRVLGESDIDDEEKSPQSREEITKDVDQSNEGAALHEQETIGKTPITLSRLSLSPPPSQNSSPSNATRNTTGLQRSSPRSSSNPRIRAQSTYGVPGSSASSVSSLSRHERAAGYGSMTPSPSGREGESDGKRSWKTRSRSIDRIGLGIDAGHGVGNFVDPLVIRKKEREKERGATTTRSPVVASPGGPKGRVAFGDLLAFFDPEKQ